MRLNVEVSGVGPPVTLLHGFTGSLRSWDTLAVTLERYHRVIRVDLPGHALSDAPRDPAAYSMESCLRYIRDALASAGVERTALVGYSMGGRLALYMAIHAPELVTDLILESASPGIRDSVEREARARSDDQLADFIEAGGIESFVDAWERIPLFESQHSLPERTRAAVRQERLRNHPRGLAGSLRGMGTGVQEPLWDRLHLVRVPTLLMVGALDSKFVAINEEMARAMPQVRLETVPGAGHTIHLERPDRFAELTGEFLARNTT